MSVIVFIVAPLKNSSLQSVSFHNDNQELLSFTIEIFRKSVKLNKKKKQWNIKAFIGCIWNLALVNKNLGIKFSFSTHFIYLTRLRWLSVFVLMWFLFSLGILIINRKEPPLDQISLWGEVDVWSLTETVSLAWNVLFWQIRPTLFTESSVITFIEFSNREAVVLLDMHTNMHIAKQNFVRTIMKRTPLLCFWMYYHPTQAEKKGGAGWRWVAKLRSGGKKRRPKQLK